MAHYRENEPMTNWRAAWWARVRHAWAQSTWYRVALVAATIYVVIRFLIQVAMIVFMTLYGGVEGYDVQIYLDTAEKLVLGQDLYEPAGRWAVAEVYYYTPAYALVFVPLRWLPLGVLLFIFTILHFIAYGFLYARWDEIFARIGLTRGCDLMIWTLPLWLVFTVFWGDLTYLNVYIVLALFSTLFIEALLRERLGLAVLWLSVILQMKPQWAFAALVPLLLGRYRFFFKLIGWTVLVYLVVAGMAMLVMGPTYGWEQYTGYIQFLSRVQADFPWRGPDAPFLGYNHSVMQLTVYLLGEMPAAFMIARVIKLVLLTPLVYICLRSLIRPNILKPQDDRRWFIDLAFVLYLGAFLWLDVVWELALSIVIFVYLLATIKCQWVKNLLRGVFLIYALLDVWRFLSFIIFGPRTISSSGAFLLTDPATYIPVILFLTITFYFVLIGRLLIVDRVGGDRT